MKDAANPERLIDGSSVYQDRLLFTLLAITISWIVSLVLKERLIEVVGNSGDLFLYSTNDYIGFVAINFAVLSLTLWLLWLLFRERVEHSRDARAVFLAVFVFLAFNETTKTYMFTPHSQLFNVLLPVWIVYLCESFSSKKDRRWFWVVFFATFFFSLNYKLMIVSFVPLLVVGKRVLGNLALWLSGLAALAVLLLPRAVVELLGGTFDNFDVSHYRSVVWILDVIKGESPPSLFIDNLANLVKSVPMIPLCYALALLLFYLKEGEYGIVLPKAKLFLVTFFAYLGLLSILGFSARRLTLSLLSILIVWLVVWLSKKYRLPGPINLLIRVSVPVQLLMWTLTIGPLV
jgi:hypothetical protein